MDLIPRDIFHPKPLWAHTEERENCCCSLKVCSLRPEQRPFPLHRGHPATTREWHRATLNWLAGHQQGTCTWHPLEQSLCQPIPSHQEPTTFLVRVVHIGGITLCPLFSLILSFWYEKEGFLALHYQTSYQWLFRKVSQRYSERQAKAAKQILHTSAIRSLVVRVIFALSAAPQYCMPHSRLVQHTYTSPDFSLDIKAVSQGKGAPVFCMQVPSAKATYNSIFNSPCSAVLAGRSSAEALIK